MSVKVTFARQLLSKTVHKDDQLWQGFTLLSEVDTQVGYYEVMFTGYKGTYRTRLKRFSAIQDGFAYLDKLSAGGWMGYDDYCDAQRLLLKLATVCHVDVAVSV